MAQYQDLATRLLAYGEAMELQSNAGESESNAGESENRGTYLLYIDHESSELMSKLWNGEKNFGKKTFIADGVRPNSTAGYILTPTTQLIICVSTDNELRALSYSDEDDEWVDDESIMSHRTHPESKVEGTIDANEHVCVVFQDPSACLVVLDRVGDSWTPTILPVDPMVGSPIGITTVHKMYIFYMSAKDNCIHYVTSDGDAGWNDKVFASCKLEGELKPKRFMITLNMNDRIFEVYVMTERNALLKITAAGENDGLKVLGKVNDKGDYEADGTAQRAGYIWMTPGNGNWYPVPVNWQFNY